MKIREAIAAALKIEQLETIFGVMGDGNMLLWSDLVEREDIKVLNARTETGAMLMAYGFTQASGGLGIVTVTHGPGLASAAVGLGVATASGAPILVIAGDVPRSVPDHVQAFQQEIFGNAFGVRVFSIRSAAGAMRILHQAIQYTRLKKGPALLTIAVDVQEEPCPEDYVPTAIIAYQAARWVGDDGACNQLATDLTDAKRPLLVAGKGARDAASAIERLAEKCGALLGTTIPARGLFAGNERDVGVIGGLCEPAVRPIIHKADLVVAFGASLNRFTLDFGKIAPSARFALVTDQPPTAYFQAPVAPIIIGEATECAERLAAAMRPQKLDSGWDLAALTRGRKDEPPIAGPARDQLFDPRAVVRLTNDIFPVDRTEVVGVGHFGGWPGLFSNLGRSGLFIGPWEFGAIGLSVPTAIGAALARPGRPVLAWEGDGSLLWSLGELETLARISPNVTVVVMDDGAYGAEVWKLKMHGRGTETAQFNRCRIADVATALGIDGYHADDEKGLELALRRSADGGPSLVHVHIDPEITQRVF